MKSKKKLIYKLHQNFNQNPYKVVEQTSFRNAGIKSYDFNKLKSIRALSLRGQPSQLYTKKNNDQSITYSAKRPIDYQEKDKLIQQKLIKHEKKVKIDNKEVDNIGKYLDSTIKQQDFMEKQDQQKQMKHSQSIKQNKFQQDTEKQLTQYQQNAINTTTGYKLNLQKLQTRPKNPMKHQRNVSLPVITSHLQTQAINKTVNIMNKREYMQSFIDQEKAKELVMRQLGLKNSLTKINSMSQNLESKQQKINNQVLASIKLKSTNNLQRIARSRSEVVIVDKWKEKYGQSPMTKIKKINQAMEQKVIEKLLVTQNYQKSFLPKLQVNQRYDEKVMGSQQLELMAEENQKSYSKQESQESSEKQHIYTERYEDSDFKKQYSSTQIISSQQKHEKKHIFCLKHYLSRQNLNTQRPKQTISAFKEDFFQNQPLQITVTKIKKHERINKQNLNLQNQTQKSKLNANLTQKINKMENKPASNSQNSQVLEKIVQNEDKAPFESITQKPLSDQVLQNQKSNQKIKSFLSFKQFKGQNDKKQGLPNINISKSKLKFKINQQKVFLQKIVQNDAMIEWENKRYAEAQQQEFHAFVRHRVNQMIDD